MTASADVLFETSGDFKQTERCPLAIGFADGIEQTPVFGHFRAEIDGSRIPASDDARREE